MANEDGPGSEQATEMTVVHKTKIAVIVGKGNFRVVECVCGWSSRLCQTDGEANQAYQDHKSESA